MNNFTLSVGEPAPGILCLAYSPEKEHPNSLFFSSDTSFIPLTQGDETLRAGCRCLLDGGELKVFLPSGRRVSFSGFSLEEREDQDGFTGAFQMHMRPDEAVYGLGQHQNGLLDQKGKALTIWHDYNGWGGEVIGLPFLISSDCYAVILENTSRITLDPLSEGGFLWKAEVADFLLLYLLTGDSFDALYQGYYSLTGRPPLPPLWGLGYIQCKQRYKNREELLAVARAYREKGYPCDLLVIDWFHWPQLGDLCLDERDWPDPGGMVKQLTTMGFHVMISCWPRFMKESRHYDQAARNGWFMTDQQGNVVYGTPEDQRGAVLDTINPEAGRWFWEWIREGYADKGFDAWWLDECEPDISPDPYRFQAGSGKRLYNLYPYCHQKAVYEGHRRDLENRCLILARSAFLGSQAFGTTYWSSDISPTWDTFRRQIPCGINFCASGMPYWSSDIGGWMPLKHHSAGFPYYEEEYTELYIRWFQYGAFCPTFRAHGTRTENEVWSFGQEAEETLVKYLRLRYRLLPYIYALAYQNHICGSPIMRGLFMDFPYDPQVRDVKDEFLLGPSLLVAPVTQPGARCREVYLPSGADWYEFETNRLFHGGRRYIVAAPLHSIPLFVRMGAVLPLADPVPHTGEMPRGLELRAYAGADGAITLYLDDGVSYAYEQGVCQPVPIEWRAGKLLYDRRMLTARYAEIRECIIADQAERQGGGLYDQ